MALHATITVHKFGGKSLENANAYRHIATLLQGQEEALVLSASADTTATLQQLMDDAKARKDFHPTLKMLQQFQHTLIEALIPKQRPPLLQQALHQDITDIAAILQTVEFVNDFTDSMSDRLLGYGELWSTRLMATYLAQFHRVLYVDASQVLFVEKEQGLVTVNWEKSAAALTLFLKNKTYDQLIITGFIASTPDGKLTTLGRNGSDFSAAIFSYLLNAKALIKWTDVDGICSADPHKVRSAFTIKTLSYKEALELAYFGANVIHPQAIYPAIEKKIPIYIKNIHEPNAEGTCITNQKGSTSQAVRGLSSIDHIALINIEGCGMIGVSGVAARIFQQLSLAQISVILISQASSEYSICFAIQEQQAPLAMKVLKKQFAYEIEQKQIEAISACMDCAILAVVGDSMVGSPGVAGKLFSLLARSNINIRAISQGSSERNISVVIQRDEINRALRAVHGGFYLSNKTISIGLIGPGGVGATLLTQINKNLKDLEKKYAVKLHVRGIMNSKKMLLHEECIDLTTWQENLTQQGREVDLKKFTSHILSDDIPHAVIIDCSASQTITDHYLDFIEQGLHIITPNKKANSGDYHFYEKLKRLAAKKHRYYLYETTVCAGLPVIKTLQDLIQTGDEHIVIEGIVSGTLAYIFDELSQGKKFSSVVKQAQALGYTEPDAREDLSGMDVARKFTCLARELGFKTDLHKIEVCNLVPEALRSIPAKDFLTRLPEYDDEMAHLLQKKLKPKGKLCYVGSINPKGGVKVDIQSFPPEHSFYNLKGTDNILIFKTKRYHDFPLIIQGPGAGTEVTAAGVFADLLRLISFLSL